MKSFEFFKSGEVTPGDLVNHLFLPKRLPQKEELNLADIELTILQYLTSHSNLLLNQLSLQKTLQTLQTWVALQEDWDALPKTLTDMPNNASVCVYVRMQNCTVLFTKLSEEFLRVVTFRGSLPSENVTGTCGSLKVTYPETVNVVPISSLLLSSCFSKQLENFNFDTCSIAMPSSTKARKRHDEVREPSHPYMVTDFLVGMLCPVESSQFGDVADIQKIKLEKKVRDQINWNKCYIPFRRSGLWMSVKVILQLGLQEEMEDRKEALVVYKMVILETLTNLAVEYTFGSRACWDTSAQILTKLARRAKKLAEMKETVTEGVKLALEATLKQTWESIDAIHEKLSEQWTTTACKSACSSEIALINRKMEDWKEDCVHEMAELARYLNQENSFTPQVGVANALQMIHPVLPTQQVTWTTLLHRANGLSDTKPEEKRIWAYQVEWFVRNNLDKAVFHCNCGWIYNLLMAYFDTAFPLYSADPVLYSRLTVTVLKFVAVLDKIATDKHPLLKKYKTGIFPEMLENLLIPENNEIEFVEELQNYFAQRYAQADRNYWLESSDVRDTDFCVQFARQDRIMRLRKQEIVTKMNKDVTAKREEIQSVKAKWEDMERKKCSLSCKMVWNSELDKNEHQQSYCERCRVGSDQGQLRRSVKPYQRPVPIEDFLQDAVVFERNIPQEIAVLRDSVLLLLEQVVGYTEASLMPKVKETSIHTKWNEFSELTGFPKSEFQKVCHLGSQSKSVLVSHYGKNPDLLKSSESDFIWESGLNCKYFRTDSALQMPSDPFTLKISSAEENDAVPYKVLQFALDAERSTENQVLATQYQCHQNLTTREFITFGSLRSGNRLQIRNLYAAMASKTLSFEKEPVLQLVMQIIWELGPEKRDIYWDFTQEPFSLEFVQLLELTLTENATNWSNPGIMLCIAVIAVRILELSESALVRSNVIAQVLQPLRSILEEWSTKLEELLVKSCQEETKLLMTLLLKSTVCSLLTFNVSSKENLKCVLRDPSDVTCYLKSLSRLYHLVVRENILKEASLSEFMKQLVRHARLVVPLNLQEHLHQVLVMSDFNQALHEFVGSKWYNAKEIPYSAIPTFCQYGGANVLKQHAYQGTYKIGPVHHQVCVDILHGTFFVDGYPPSVLPEKIIRDPLFKTFFQSSQFRVQRDSRTFQTSDKYRGLHFQFIDFQNQLLIRQMSSKCHWFQLLPRKLLDENVPHDLILNYTHWFNSKTKAVHFRRPSSSDTEENIEADTDFLLVPTTDNTSKLPVTWRLQKYTGSHTQSDCYLLSIKSLGFLSIVQNLLKLEDKKYIHVELDCPKARVSAELWRLHLSFSLNPDNSLLYCDNYPGYYIPTTENGGQDLGTLVGLQSGVVLEKQTIFEAGGKKRFFVIPHGTISLSKKDGDSHQTTLVTNSPGLRNPPYFVYEVDTILKRLRPGNNRSAWLYLALLHGATSSPFPDPFTQLTGTEMAIWILQSGYSWSCSPYDAECLDTLEQISNLSPKREYYPSYLKVMETVHWPAGLVKNSYAAYDGYAIIVEKLLQDSVRLEGLFSNKSLNTDNAELDLHKRSYFRNINFYNKAAHLSDLFIDDPNKLTDSSIFTLPSSLPNNGGELEILANYRRQGVAALTEETVKSFIVTDEPLPPNFEDFLSNDFVPTWLTTNLRESWLQLYSLALHSHPNEKEHEVTLLLGSILYSGNGSLKQLLNLHNITVGSRTRNMSLPEPVKSLTNEDYHPGNHRFIRSTITKILEETADKPPLVNNYTTYQGYEAALQKFQVTLKEQLEESTNNLFYDWRDGLMSPSGAIDVDDLNCALRDSYLLHATQNAVRKINRHLLIWENNWNLVRFCNRVDTCLQKVCYGLTTPVFEVMERLKGELQVKTVVDAGDKWQDSQDLFNEEELAESVVAWQSFPKEQLHNGFFEKRNHCIKMEKALSEELEIHVLGRNYLENLALRKAGLHVRLAPVALIRSHFGTTKNRHVGALVEIWAYLKRLNRLIMYSMDKEKYTVELTRELETEPCTNWNPKENPEWLLLELELDITIRPIQVEVARRMMAMPEEKNGVMQLNMGEGKTSVIIPMIVATLAKQMLLCRVTVLNSIYATNQNLLAFTIGGFLYKRLYTVPCSRDLDIAKYLDQIDAVYRECLRLGGVVLTLPEYRLSFRLQIYNNFLQERKQDVGAKIHAIESWLRKHARDLVDESDEIFSVKYQLIYSTGSQQPIGGGNLRWRVCQKLLEYVPQVAAVLVRNYGTKAVEFEKADQEESSEKFGHLRILSEECKEDFLELMADGILDGKLNLLGKIFGGEEKKVLKSFLISDHISEDEHDQVFKITQFSAEKKQVLLLICGYLRKGILFAALTKRWRVEYGTKQSKSGLGARLMAVPLRAKDVAAERTEFGHPDMAIVLTQLSYYYSGLSDQQLMDCFRILRTEVTGPETVYNSWIKKIPSKKAISDTVKTYKGINLQDYEQRTLHLFPLLRHHKAVIDFWLENAVFPKESKQFPGKLVTNAWDLVYHRNDHPTTGFSGTNDTSLLLPAQITQQDLAILKETNKEMEEILKQKENQLKRALQMGCGCEQVLLFMIQDDLRVLIDAGALMLELDNEALAKLWLTLDPSLEGVVYFNKSGEMVVKSRESSGYMKRLNRKIDQLLTLSPFKDHLEKCAIYLDDQHTRGTDVNLPTNFKACVTVGSGMRRDKLIQACMRMRKLGNGQSVHFYLSHEVANKIQLQIKPSGPITVDDIINWTKLNSCKFEQDGLLYWATNAKTYAKNLIADDLFEASSKSENEAKILAERCEDPDAQDLEVMYGTYHHRVRVTELVPKWFSNIQTKLKVNCPISLFVIKSAVVEKCRRHIPEAVYFQSLLDEEQEKELEPEQEMERYIYRPSRETPEKPTLHKNVRLCVTKMNETIVMDGISKLSDIFRSTSLSGKLQADGWGDQCLVTEDFIQVIRRYGTARGNVLDSFLRPIRFFVSFKNEETVTLLVMSLHEVNSLMPFFRKMAGVAKGTKLHMFSGRWMEGQPIFADKSSLELPVTSNNENLTSILSPKIIAPLLIASGNLYFDGIGEQMSFARFLGLRLRPWGKLEQAAFRDKWITSAGFVLPTCPLKKWREGCYFQEDPTEMVRGILKIRNEILRDGDHAVYILENCAYVNTPPVLAD